MPEGDKLVDAMKGPPPGGSELLRQRDRLVRLERLLDTGLILLGTDGLVRLANERATEMFKMGDRDWSEMAPLLEALVAAAGDEEESCEVEVEPTGRPLRATVTSCEGGTLRVVELRDSRALDGVEADLMIATRVKNLTRLWIGLTHDLKAPLNAIMLHLELLRRSLARDAGARDDDDMEPLVRVDLLDSELHRLQRCLDVLLDQAVPAASERSTFDLRNVVGELGELLRAPARQNHHDIAIDLPDTAIEIEAKRDHVKQALLNVAVNGLEAMRGGGGQLRFLVSVDGDRAQVVISDTGSGVDPDVRDRVFDIYITGKESGVGAGLYFARLMLESEGGSIDLTSTSSRGTTFTAKLPTAGS